MYVFTKFTVTYILRVVKRSKIAKQLLVTARKHTWRMRKKGLFWETFFIVFKNPTDLDLQYRLIILKTSLLFIILIGKFERFSAPQN